MTQGDLAFVLGVGLPAVNQIAVGRRGISAEMARALSAVFDVPAEDILKLQKDAELRAELARTKGPSPTVARNAKLLSKYPVREMVKRGWLDEDRATFEAQLARFFDVKSIDEVPHLDHAGKKSDYSAIPPAQLAWLFRVRHLAREMVLPRYSEAALRGMLSKLRDLLIEPEETRHVPRMLHDCGVRFVLVQALPSAKIDGACFWLGPAAPVIGLSMRFDRIDNFWFVLRHEIEHVLRGDGRSAAKIDSELELESPTGDADLPPEEVAANEAARDFCVPTSELDSWMARKAPFFSERDLIGFSKRLGVHPGIVAGQLRRRTSNYKLFSRYLTKVQSIVAGSATVDGWGQIAPIG